jgi:uncharacterized protein YoxC
MVWEIGVLLVGIAVVVIAAVFIPTLIELRKTITEAKETLALFNSELVPLLREIRAVSEHVNTLSDRVERGVGEALPLFSALGELGRSLERAQQLVQSRGMAAMGRALAVSVGVKTAAGIFRKRGFFKQRSATNGR